MKKIILGMAVLVALSLSSFTTVEPISTAVVKQFKETYPTATSVKWYQGKDYYQVNFTQYDTRTIIYYTNEDLMFRTIRYYGEDHLPPFIVEKINTRYKNKDIKSVTELAEKNEALMYQIVLEDSRNIIIVKSDSYGNLHTAQKMKKSL